MSFIIGDYKMPQNKKNPGSGFTILEMLVVISIIGILTVTAIVNIEKNDDRDVRTEKDRLASFLREVQNKALAGDRLGIPTSGVRVCGFGVHKINDSQIKVYYISTTDMNIACGSLNNTYGSGYRSDFNDPASFNLQQSVKLSGTFPDIFFFSPNGTVYKDGSLLTETIGLSLTKGSATLINAVSIDISGRIF